jgi:hypothetical protein
VIFEKLFETTLRLPVLAIVLLLAALVLLAAAWQRGTEYDEGYTVFLASGTARPDWPAVPFRASDMRGAYHGHSSATRIAEDLRQNDVHPPLYFWAAAAWRGVAGTDLLTTRLLSVLCSLAALVVLAHLAASAGAPPALAVLLTLGCYGFSYTGAIARGFALAQWFTLSGVLLLLLAERRRRIATAFAGGLLLGAATLTNYLAAFVAAAALLWLVPQRSRDVALWLAGCFGFALVLPADLFFFLAQRDSRTGQFPPFHIFPSLVRLGRYAAANVFGGLPLYLEGLARTVLGVALSALWAGLVVLIAVRWRRLGSPGPRALLGMAAIAPAMGLILLGLVFDNTPIELRYLAFAVPFFAVLLAAAIASVPRQAAVALSLLVLGIQAASLLGMITRPETMQPQRAIEREAARFADDDGLVLVPRGNDGVGVVGAMVNEAPDGLRLLTVAPGETTEQLRTLTAPEHRVVLALAGLDADSRAVLPVMKAAFRDNRCWRQAGGGNSVLVYERKDTAGPCVSP